MYSGYGIESGEKGERSFGNDLCKNVVIFQVDSNSSPHTDIIFKMTF